MKVTNRCLNTKKFTIGAMITLMTLSFSTTFGAAQTPGETDQKCKPYPLCKLFNEQKELGDTSIRMMQPMVKTNSQFPANIKSNAKRQLNNKKRTNVEK